MKLSTNVCMDPFGCVGYLKIYRFPRVLHDLHLAETGLVRNTSAKV